MHKNNYGWIGISAAGQKVAGTIYARKKHEAFSILKNNHVTILSIKKKLSPLLHRKKLFSKERLDFIQQLQLLLQANLPIVDSLSLIKNTSANLFIQELASQLNQKIIEGMSLSEACRQLPECFDHTFCHMILAGEQSGKLDMVLSQLSENDEQRLQIKTKILKALLYPMSVMIIAMIISIGLLLFVIPQFNAIYENFGAQLPSLTRYLITLSHLLLHHSLFCVIAIMALISILLTIQKRYVKLKKYLQTIIFACPMIHKITVTYQIAQWSSVMAMTLSSHVAIIDALQIANQMISHPLLCKQMNHVKNAIMAGQSLRLALKQCTHFPLRAKTMIAIGENADALPIMMKKIASLYQQQFDETLDRLSKLIEPVIMMIVASIVSGLIIAMYLPIFRMGSII